MRQEELTIGKLRMLPKQVMHQTLMAVIVFEYSGKLLSMMTRFFGHSSPRAGLKKCNWLLDENLQRQAKEKISIRLVGDAEKSIQGLKLLENIMRVNRHKELLFWMQSTGF